MKIIPPKSHILRYVFSNILQMTPLTKLRVVRTGIVFVIYTYSTEFNAVMDWLWCRLLI